MRALIPVLVLLLLGITTNLSAQNSLKQLDVGLASPEAAELAKYGNLEVNMFKGVPNVTVPLYTLKAGEFSLPIFLAYDASGIRVDQIATNVGLGWSLHAGGQITAAVYGKDDFYEPVKSFVQNSSELQNFDPNVWVSNGDTTGYEDYLKAWDMYDPLSGGVYKNLKPDVFYYSFAGNNGKFVIDGDINNYFTHYTVPYRKLKISYSSTTGFEVTDVHGNTYIFDELETASISDDQNNCAGGPGSSGGQAKPVPIDKLIKTSRTWHLGRIETAGGDIISFTYDSSQTSYTYTNSEIEQKYEPQSVVAECESSIPDYNCITKKTITPKRISSIEHVPSGQRVDFVYSTTARQDFGNSSYTAMDSIIVKRHGQTLKAFDLDTDSYFGTSGNERLKLSGVKQVNMPAGYTFEYNTAVSLPARLSKSQDHWGYYNGKSNSTLIPNTMISGGGDRSVDTSKVGAWALERINYPNGGSTVLNLEGIPGGGGLRVKNIYDLNGMNDTTGTRYFEYGTPANAGGFHYVDMYEYYLEGDYSSGSGEPSCKYNMYTSSNVPPIHTMDSPDYGFKKVTIKHEQDSTSGETEYIYSDNFDELSSAAVGTDPGALRWGRGELLRTTGYNAAGNKLTEQKQTFGVHKTNNTLWGTAGQSNESYVYGIDIQLKRPEYEFTTSEGITYTYPARFEMTKYRVISAWYHPDSTITSRYDPTNQSIVQTTTEKRMYDPSSTQLAEVIAVNSDGQERRTQYTYAHEQYPGMGSAHILTKPYKVAISDGSGDILRIDWTLWKTYTLGSNTVWKPCSQWVGGKGLGLAPPDDPDCN